MGHFQLVPAEWSILETPMRAGSFDRSTYGGASSPTDRWSALTAALVALLWVGASIAQAQGTQGPIQGGQGGAASYEVSSDPNAVVLHMQEEIGALEQPGSGPSVTLYANGRTVVQYPVYMKRAGTYEITLAPAEMRVVVESLLAGRIIEFDASAVRERKRAIREAQRTARAAAPPGTATELDLSGSFDVTTTHIDMQLALYRPAHAGEAGRLATALPVQHNVVRSISWHGLRGDARHFPEVEEIQKLAEASRLLRALMERGDLVKVE